jgi:hypothetical protein
LTVRGADPIDTRPGLRALLERIVDNAARTVIVEDASRFARTLLLQEAAIATLAGLGAHVTDIPRRRPHRKWRRNAPRRCRKERSKPYAQSVMRMIEAAPDPMTGASCLQKTGQEGTNARHKRSLCTPGLDLGLAAPELGRF